MRVGEIFGSVTLSRCLPEVRARRFVLIQPESAAALRGDGANLSDPLVAIDELSAGPGARVAFSEGREASMPFAPQDCPADAYVAALLDEVTL
jgi:ethanolamine utilization protein EutN